MKIDWPKMILRLRAKLNYSQEELGKMLGVSLASVSRWERGEHEPTAIVKIKLEDLFNKYEINYREAVKNNGE